MEPDIIKTQTDFFNSEEKKMNKKIIWICVFVFLFSIIMYSGMIWAIVNDKKDLKEVNSKLLIEQSLNSTCSYQRDSLVQEVNNLSNYKALASAMSNRDKATSSLKYKVGDRVYLKSDSSRVVISDIIVGGSTYEYYIKYKVLHKDNLLEEIKPELIY